MPEPYEVILARVKQKIATEAEWLLVEDELGVLLEGEQAFVLNEAGLPVNFKIGDGARKFSELPYFIAYLDTVSSMRKIAYLNQDTDITIPNVFRENTNFYGIAIVNNSGSVIQLNAGTTSGGVDVLNVDIDPGAVILERDYLFTEAATLYLSGLQGKNYSLFVLYYKYDESPASLPASSSRGLFPKGYQGNFYSLYNGHAAEVWDFITGRGKAGSGYENCQLFGTGDLPSYSGKYFVGAGVGEATGERVGNTDNTAPISKANLPAEGVGLFVNEVGSVGGQIPGPNDKVTRSRGVNSGGFTGELNYEMSRSVGAGTNFVGKSQNLGEGTEMNIQPDSITVLYFVAVE